MLFKVFILLLTFTSVPLFAANLPQAANIESQGGTDGSACIITPEGNAQGYFGIEAFGGGATNLYNFYKSGVKYAVTGGKTAKCRCICYSDTSAGIGSFELLANTTTFADGIGTGTITGVQTWEFGAAATYGHPNAVANTTYCTKIIYTFAASSNTGIQVKDAGVNVSMICKEE